MKFKILGVAYTFYNGHQLTGNVVYEAEEVGGDCAELRELDGFTLVDAPKIELKVDVPKVDSAKKVDVLVPQRFMEPGRPKGSVKKKKEE